MFPPQIPAKSPQALVQEDVKPSQGLHSVLEYLLDLDSIPDNTTTTKNLNYTNRSVSVSILANVS